VRITYVVTRSEPIGGVQIHVRDLAVALQAQGHACSVVTGGGGLFVDMLRGAGVPTVLVRHLAVPIHPVRDLRALREIHATLKSLRPQLVAAHSSKVGILARLSGRMLGVPVILTAHGWNFTPGVASLPAACYRQIERLAGPLATRIITVSEFDRRLALEAGITGEDRLVTVYNGMADVAPSLRASPGRTPARLVMIARFGAQKDHMTLLRALAGLLDRPWELDLIGDGPLLGQARALAATLGLSHRIRFLGQRSDVEQLLAQAQASLLVTNWEGFPLSILEAMRAGLPVVATSVAGIGEAVVDGETGFLVPRGDVEVLRDRMAKVLADPSLRERMGSNGRARFERHFTLPVFVRNTLAVYQDVVGERADDLRYASDLQVEPTG
jgi:glycosyltransferase involved in cell wall biosynthesis